MATFREWAESLGRILGRPVIERGGDLGPIQAAERRLADALAPAPGPALLRFERARIVPVSEAGHSPGVRRRLDGELYGRPFTVWFPPFSRQPAGHRWALACWSAETSGTNRPEVLAACVTCTEAKGTSTVVGPASCVLRSAEVDAVYDALAEGLSDLWPAPPGNRGHWSGSFDLGWTVCRCWVGRNHEPWPKDERWTTHGTDGQERS